MYYFIFGLKLKVILFAYIIERKGVKVTTIKNNNCQSLVYLCICVSFIYGFKLKVIIFAYILESIGVKKRLST